MKSYLRLKRPCMFKIKLCFIDGMLEVKVFGLNEMLPNLLSKILLEVNSFMSTDDSKYEYVKEDLATYLMEGDDKVELILPCLVSQK
ncbi:nardilysin [Trifolium repens]|nr:nardilysin [Trifolium repens]